MREKENSTGIHFHFLHSKTALKERRRLKLFIALLFKKERTSFETLNFIFCTDQYLLEINRQFLQHDYYTDIITFNMSSKSEPVVADIYISLDRVKENAHALQQYVYKEMHRVIFHGALHLCGYKDKQMKDKNLMRQKEDFYLDKYFTGRST